MSIKSKLKNFFKSAAEVASDMIFPEGITCIACNGELGGGELYQLCRNCKIEFNNHFCQRCGRAVKDLAKFCDQCQNRTEYYFDYARSSLEYNKTASQLIYNFKYGNARYLAPNLAEFLYKTAQSENFLDNIDLVTFVPLHKKRQRTRGYNQAELLAKAFSTCCGIVTKPLLIKATHTKNLARLTKQERIAAIKNSFELAQDISFNKATNSTVPKPLKNKTILLIDDVLTTTATADECARILKKQGGANRVIILTLTSVESNINI